MAWTSPRTWVSGETVTAAQLNTHVRDNFLETAPAKVTTQGDIVYATGANALARLAKGTKYQLLQMNSGATAPQWSTAQVLVVKTADESVTSSASLQDDDHLLHPLAASETWAFELVLYLAAISGAATDFRFAFAAPSGASGLYHVTTTYGTAGGTAIDGANSLTTTSDVGNSGAARVVLVWGVVQNSTNAGDFKLQWCQASSNVAAVTLNKGSIMRLTRAA